MMDNAAQGELDFSPQKKSMLDRLRPHGGWPVDPVLRWNPLDPYATARIESALVPPDGADDGDFAEEDAEDLYALFAVQEGDIDAFMREPVTDEEFRLRLAPAVCWG